MELGISSRGGCLWSTDKEYRKLVSILAHYVNSVSGLGLDLSYGLALDFVYIIYSMSSSIFIHIAFLSKQFRSNVSISEKTLQLVSVKSPSNNSPNPSEFVPKVWKP